MEYSAAKPPGDARPFLQVVCTLLGVGDAHRGDVDLALPGGSHPHLLGIAAVMGQTCGTFMKAEGKNKQGKQT